VTRTAAIRVATASRIVQIVAPALAAVLSALYVVYVLRGGPRIIDATAYFLEAELLSRGQLAIPLLGPEHATLGRFLVRTAGGEAAVIFPPGYPALLALGFLVGAPMAVGPALAGAITLATMDLTRLVARKLGNVSEPLVAASGLVSATCAALRYHTADCMSHGLAALLLCVGAIAALHMASPKSGRRAGVGAPALLGLCGGWLFATRPATALALAALVLLTIERPSPRATLAIALGAAPGLALWLGYQHHATGSWLGTAQSSYYAASDGPPGCFRYGFGASIGCLGEHGDFVRHNLEDGYGAYPAVATTARRMKMHVSDAFGFAPSFALVVLGMAIAAKKRALRGIAAAPLLLMLAYVPFYFDGNYPAAGARLFADVLPIEHGLGLVACVTIAARLKREPPQLFAVVLGLSLVGVATYLGADHRHLRDREGGRPMFEPPAPEGLAFVATDHGWLLARGHGVKVARYKGDDHDRLVWEHHGRPPAWRYHHPWKLGERPRWSPLAFAAQPPSSWRIEGESLWPPAAQNDGWSWPTFHGDRCVSAGRALQWRPTGAQPSLRISLPQLPDGILRVALYRPVDSTDAAELHLLDGEHAVLHSWTIAPGRAGCLPLLSATASVVAPARSLKLTSADAIAVDTLFIETIR
jgi:hypothetical protein